MRIMKKSNGDIESHHFGPFFQGTNIKKVIKIAENTLDTKIIFNCIDCPF